MSSERRLKMLEDHLVLPPIAKSSNQIQSTTTNNTVKKDILFEGHENGAQVITLNRPEQLNALNKDMINCLGQWLTEWSDDAKVAMVVVRGAGKAFCAGGDIRALAEAARVQNAAVPREFFGPEYILVVIFKYSKPYIALLDGITMGGGVGISIGAKYRIATEKLVFAMPETSIGFVTDVGAGHFLPRLNGPKGVGLYLGLTGARLGAADSVYTGVATHFVKSESIPALLEAFISLKDPSQASIEEVLRKFSAQVGAPPLEKIGPLIEHCFGSVDSVETIYQKLDGIINSKYTITGVEKKQAVEWAQATLRTLNARSPLSLKVVYELLKQGQHLDIASALRLEYRLAMRMVVTTPAFYEGVRAVIIDKDNKPKWVPSSLEEVDSASISDMFMPFNSEELRVLGPELYG